MFNSNLYSVVIKLLPINLRKEKILAWMKVFVVLIKNMMETFTLYRTEKLFFLAHNSQVIYLEHILNNRFNPFGNVNDSGYEGLGIYISDAQTFSEAYLYNTSETGDDKYLYNSSETGFDEIYLRNSSETEGLAGFVVNVPDTFGVNENEIKAMVQRLKLAGKQFEIKYYTI